MRSHIQTINYNIQIGDNIIERIGIFNCNKLPTGVAIKCIETDTFNKYLITMTRDQYVAIFLDDNEFNPEIAESVEETSSEPVPTEDATSEDDIPLN